MAKKTTATKTKKPATKTPKAETSKAKAPKVETPKVETPTFTATTADRGEGNDYGQRNCISHGRYAQGGLIDQLFIKSVKTGEGFTLKELNAQRVLDNEERVKSMNSISFSRFESHRIHLIEQHNATIEKGRAGDNIVYRMVYDIENPPTNSKGETVSQAELLDSLTL